MKIVETHLQNHTRWGYRRFGSFFKVICHFHLAAILNFGDRKKWKPIFLNPYVSKI